MPAHSHVASRDDGEADRLWGYCEISPSAKRQNACLKSIAAIWNRVEERTVELKRAQQEAEAANAAKSFPCKHEP
jgi:hypothetical protein